MKQKWNLTSFMETSDHFILQNKHCEDILYPPRRQRSFPSFIYCYLLLCVVCAVLWYTVCFFIRQKIDKLIRKLFFNNLSFLRWICSRILFSFMLPLFLSSYRCIAARPGFYYKIPRIDWSREASSVGGQGNYGHTNAQVETCLKHKLLIC